MLRKKSLYRESFSFVLHQDQKNILRSQEARVQDADLPQYDYDQHILCDNPCHFDDVYFSGIEMFSK